MKKMRFIIPLVVVTVTLFAVLPVAAGQPGSGTTTIYVQNASGTSGAQIVATFYNKDGSSAGTVNIASLAPYVGYTVNTSAASPALPATWNGSVVVSSNQMVAAVGRTIYTGVPGASGGVTGGDYTAVADPQNSSFLSYVFNSGGRNNVISIQNTENTAATVTIHYIRRSNGTEIPGGATCSGSPITDTIPPNGVVYYDLLNLTRNGVASGGVGGKIPCMSATGTTQTTAGTLGGFEGAVYVESTTKVAVATSTHWAQFMGAYTGATSDDTKLHFPQIARAKNPATGRWNRWSALVIQNTQNFPISITVSLIGATGNSVVFSDTVPALSSLGYNTRFQGNFPANMWTGCTSTNGIQPGCWLENAFGTPNWLGAATVQVNTAGGRIVGVNHVQYDDGRVFTYEGLQPSSATTIAVCPVMQDQDLSANPNKHWSAAIIQNPTGSNAIVDIYVFKQGNTTGGVGGANLTLDNSGAGYTINPGERLGLNTRYDVTGGPSYTVFNPLGNNWIGSAVIISRNQPILVTMSVFRSDSSTGQNWATDYNCYNTP